MKKIAIVLAALALVVLFSTCKPKTTSIDECISTFMSDINSNDRSSVYTTLDPSSLQYSVAKPASYWDTRFPTADIPYSLTGLNTSTSPVTANINSNLGLLFNGELITFVMSMDSGENAVIHSITIAGAAGVVFQ